MIRTGWQIYKQDEGFWKPFGGVYMSKNTAQDCFSKLHIKNKQLIKIQVIEDDESIDDFYNQIEQENPQYQTALSEVITKAVNDPSSKVTNVREWLTTFSLCDES